MTTFISLLILNSISAQEIGEIFTAKEANLKFGKVLEHKSVPSSTVKEWLILTSDKIMFQLKNKNFTVLRDSRNLLYTTTSYSETDEQFHMYSKSKLAELINKGGNSTTYFEIRGNVFSITNGNYTLEMSTFCPPDCY